MPPTVTASGMNFKEMPELNWRLGYPLALFVSVRGGAALPLLSLEEMALALAPPEGRCVPRARAQDAIPLPPNGTARIVGLDFLEY